MSYVWFLSLCLAFLACWRETAVIENMTTKGMASDGGEDVRERERQKGEGEGGSFGTVRSNVVV